jgi:hypothetical protein
MFGRQRNLDTPNATPRSVQRAIDGFQDGSITYEQFKQKTKQKIKPAGFSSGRQNYHKLLMENSTPRGNPPAREQFASTSSPHQQPRNVPKLQFEKRNTRLGAAGRHAIQAMNVSIEATPRAPELVVPKRLLDPRPFSLDSLTSRLPEHQLKVLASDPMYTPDPNDGLSKWPIPGMQGSRTPFVLEPYATNGKATRVQLSTQQDMEQKGLESTAVFDKGLYHSDGLGSKPVWKGKHSMDELMRVQRSYEQSGMMTILLPGQSKALVPTSDPNKRTLFICGVKGK